MKNIIYYINRIKYIVTKGHFLIASLYGGAQLIFGIEELNNVRLEDVTPKERRNYEKAIRTYKLVNNHLFYLEPNGYDIPGWYIYGLLYLLDIN